MQFLSHLAETRQPIGYSIELCTKVIEAVKRELKRTNLVVKYVPVSTSSRISALTSGEIDLECGSTTSTAERRKEVEFTIPTFIAAARLLVPPRGRMLALGGRRVRVIDEGRGRPVVVIHGLGGQAENFAPTLRELAGFRCVSADRAGAGRSDPGRPGAEG